MDIETLNTLAESAPAVTLLLIASITSLIYLRTGSWHVPAIVLWRLFAGRKRISDPVVRRFLDRQSSLMSFRFVTGFGARVRTLESAHRLEAFVRSGSIAMEDVQLSGGYFDLDGLKMRRKPPGDVFQSLKALAIVPIAFLAVWLALASSR